jgi:hypothetical protein
MNKKLSILLARPDIWQASASPQQSGGLSTGYPLLDQSLHLGGWPVSAITELLCDHSGIGELEILLPTLAQYASQNRKLVLIAPPYIPYAPALQSSGIALEQVLVIQTPSRAEQLWAFDQLLRADVVGAVLCWLDSRVKHQQLRKLQLAAQLSHSMAVLFRPTRSASEASPAALRIALSPTPRASHAAKSCRLHILKQRGGWAGQIVDIPRPNKLLEMRVSASGLPVHIPGNSLQDGSEYSPNHKAPSQNIDMHWDFEAHFPNNPFDLSPDKTHSEIDNTLH